MLMKKEEEMEKQQLHMNIILKVGNIIFHYEHFKEARVNKVVIEICLD